jgi:acetylornithine deacetylase/succinyl-diaminopimelate desuccinylase-like protein
MNMHTQELYNDAVSLLKQLIAIPSFSKEEDKTAALIGEFLSTREIRFERHLNNIYSVNKYFDASKPTLLLNSHHDTVKPNHQYTKDPFQPIEEDGKLFGLGSNDAGGPLVSLIATYIYFYQRQHMHYNIALAASAEEEISGKGGIETIMPLLPKIDFAVVGEPTEMHLAVAEKGLLVSDCISNGKSGHAARNEGDNAVYKALKDIEWFRNFVFPKVSSALGPMKMSVTVINTENKAHNVVPAQCSFVVDVRVTDEYTHEEVVDIISRYVSCEVKPRSMRMRSSKIDINHPIVQAGIRLGKKTYGSPTTSDQALIAAPSLKCGPGDSARSHTADEYIYLKEIEEGIEGYIRMIEDVVAG